jgi:hypothetical protein
VAWDRFQRESLERSPWADQVTDCKIDYKVVVQFVEVALLSKSGHESDGEADFLDRENYIVKSTSISKIGEQVRIEHDHKRQIPWLSCGGLKPLEPARPDDLLCWTGDAVSND